MDERAVRAATERIVSEANGLYLGTGVQCRMVPVDAIDELVAAVAGEPAGVTVTFTADTTRAEAALARARERLTEDVPD